MTITCRNTLKPYGQKWKKINQETPHCSGGINVRQNLNNDEQTGRDSIRAKAVDIETADKWRNLKRLRKLTGWLIRDI
jgi:hypothetical protein